MLQVKIKPEHSGFKLPVKGSEDAACYDAHISRLEAQRDGVMVCYLGFSTEFDKQWKGVIVPRSNLTKYGYCIINSPCQIDSDYRGEWIVKFQPVQSNCKFPYSVGERCCQIYFEFVNSVELIQVTELTDTVRGDGGFGSTGK